VAAGWRYAADGLSKRLNRPVVVANRPDANSAVAYASFARSAPDRFPLLITAVMKAGRFYKMDL